jgi:hypothetical protein
MTDRLGKPSKWRRSLVVVAPIVVLLVAAIWVLRPRFDSRLIGTWTNGDYQMVIRNDGFADGFFGRTSGSDGGTGYAVGGPFKVRTSGNHIEIVRLVHDQTTVRGWLQYALAVLKGQKTESVELWGTILEINDQTMALEMRGLETVLDPRGRRHLRSEYRRDKDVPFDTHRVVGRMFDRLRSLDRSQSMK